MPGWLCTKPCLLSGILYGTHGGIWGVIRVNRDIVRREYSVATALQPMILPPVNEFRLPEKRPVVNVFVDLCGSTAAGERLQNTRQLFELLDRWQRLAAFIFCNYGGKIGASDSDMVMGYFMGSEAEQLAMSRALLAAYRIREKTIQFGQKAKTPLNVHVGLHCGEVEVGPIGPDIRHNLTTIGPPVNIAARLEGKADKGEIFISGQMASQTWLHWEGEYVDAYPLKGVAQLVDCYRVKFVPVPSNPTIIHEPTDSEWVIATIEAQALEEIGRQAESLQLAERAARRYGAPSGLAPILGLLPKELCIRGYLALRRTNDAVRQIREFADQALQLSAYREHTRAIFYMAECFMQQSKFREAIAEFDKAKQGYESHGSGRDVADSLYYAGVCYQWQNDQPQATKSFKEAKKRYLLFIDQQEADPVEVGKACLELSMLVPDEPPCAAQILSRAQKIFQENCQFRHLVTALLNMSCVANRMLLFTDAENYARRGLELARDFDPVDGVGLAYGNIGAALENRGDLINAKTYYEMALEIAGQTGDGARCEQIRGRIHRVEVRRRRLMV